MPPAPTIAIGHQHRPEHRGIIGRPNASKGNPPATEGAERAYQRGSQFAKRAALMAEWAVYCATVQTEAVVKPIRGAA